MRSFAGRLPVNLNAFKQEQPQDRGETTRIPSFMMWRLPMDATQSPEYVRFPLTCPPSEGDICKAMTTQYRSTYRCDFTGLPQGITCHSLLTQR
ncbi:Hypothetical protein SMAX5B_004548 [Scophthalmus maximus]|uniref:Uncharacterized protein n=1 Tax=Scophthalmus maximus TaxID=52904 RepID=A0A2U9B4P0_SCOMX|nr:Hypothetical protein SMAX5B_004548 [Scophthalmus maximus]